MTEPELPDDKLSFNDLTAKDKAMICNGCGGKGGWVKPPSWLFRASCNHHDFEYWRGGTIADRKHADDGFYAAMKEDAQRATWWLRGYQRFRAWVFYRAVRIGGASYFNVTAAPRGRKALDVLHETERRRRSSA